MRYSSDKADPGYGNWERAFEAGDVVRVFLDEVEQRRCDMADEEEGVIRRCVVDGDGKIQRDPNAPDMVWMETVTGAVRIAVGPA